MKIMYYKKRDKKVERKIRINKKKGEEIIAQRIRFLKCVRCESTSNLRPYKYVQIVAIHHHFIGKPSLYKALRKDKTVGKQHVPVCDKCFNLFKIDFDIFSPTTSCLLNLILSFLSFGIVIV